MDENNYRNTYHSVNPLQCPFERTLNSRRCQCSMMKRFNLADREGVACKKQAPLQLCKQYLEIMRHNAKFALKMTHVDDPLPHGKEIKVQNGSVNGLQELFYPGTLASGIKPDIYQLIADAIKKYGRIDNLPLNELMPFIVHFQARKKRNKNS